jgi:radical SAM-linked protein
MRDVINKNVTEEQLMETAERVFSRGWTKMKLYFMIGLPTEDESDVREIVRVGERARQVGKRVKGALKDQGKPNGGGAPTVTVSVSTHVPKPHTPFQWCAMDSADVVRQKQSWLREEKRATKGVELRTHDCDTSWLEGVFARGDRKLGPVLERAYAAGARFDSWEDQLKIDVWAEAFRSEGIDVVPYLGTLPVTARLPWDHIDVGLEEGFLAREYRKALDSRLSLPCGKAAGMFVQHTNLADAEADTRKLVCYDCGIACDLGAMRTERLVYLTKLNAKTKRPSPVSPLLAPAPTKEERGDPKRAKINFTQGTPVRYRFGFTKLGPSALLSHLDVLRALPRTFRRVGLPLFYSTGFHPKPDFVFAPALSLGVSSTCEVADVKLTCDVDPASVLEALSAASPDGLDFFAGVRLGPGDRAVSRVIDTARYAVAIPTSVLDSLGGAEWLRARVTEAMAAPELRVKRTIEGIGKWVDVREYLRALEIDTPASIAAVGRAGLLGRFVVVSVDLEIRGSGAIKIGEVVEALAGTSDLPHRAVRFGLGSWSVGEVVSPFDLSRALPPLVGESALLA